MQANFYKDLAHFSAGIVLCTPFYSTYLSTPAYLSKPGCLRACVLISLFDGGWVSCNWPDCNKKARIKRGCSFVESQFLRVKMFSARRYGVAG